jgi:hypothetical protein
MPEDIRYQVWSMVFTGIEIGVYEKGDYENKPRSVHITGKKAARTDDRRNRDVPRFWAITPIARERQAFRRHLANFSKKNGLPYKVQIKDLRNTYARLLSEAGIPYARCEQYMGHRPSTMYNRYARAKIDDLTLAEDAALISSYVSKTRRDCGKDELEHAIDNKIADIQLDTSMFLATAKIKS